jgi:hypothetical protein
MHKHPHSTGLKNPYASSGEGAIPHAARISRVIIHARFTPEEEVGNAPETKRFSPAGGEPLQL